MCVRDHCYTRTCLVILELVNRSGCGKVTTLFFFFWIFCFENLLSIFGVSTSLLKSRATRSLFVGKQEMFPTG